MTPWPGHPPFSRQIPGEDRAGSVLAGGDLGGEVVQGQGAFVDAADGVPMPGEVPTAPGDGAAVGADPLVEDGLAARDESK